MNKYEYTQVNRLNTPHNYMYTPYRGLEFLDAYIDDRLTYLKNIKKSKLNGSSNTYISLYAKSCKLLIDYSKKNVHRDKLEEIFNSDAPSGSSDSIEVYWMLILSLSLFFSLTKNIKYLNTMLKVSDLLCSLDENIVFKKIPTNYFTLVLLVELNGVKSLSERTDGVCLDFT